VSAPATRDDLAWWLDLAPRLKWTFASTMPDVPHWYVQHPKTRGLTLADYQRVGRIVRTFGEPGRFYRTTNIYLWTPDRVRKFWLMWGDPVREEDARGVNLAFTDRTYGPQTDFDEARLRQLRLPVEE
jgi:hypothetical protein